MFSYGELWHGSPPGAPNGLFRVLLKSSVAEPAEARAGTPDSRTSPWSGAERRFKACQGPIDGFLVGVLVHIRCEVDG